MSIVPDLLDLMPDTISAQPGYTNFLGEFVPSGAAIGGMRCRISQGARLVRDRSGKEVVSSVRATVGGVYGLTTHQHRYTLPGRHDPNASLEAISVQVVSDEDGPHHTVISFP